MLSKSQKERVDPFAMQKKKTAPGDDSLDANDDDLIKGKELELGQEIQD